MEIIATNALISINATLIVQVVSFLVFLYLINRVMFRPLLNIIEQRNDYIDEVKQDILAETDNLGRLMQEMDQERAQAMKEADLAVKSLEADGEQRASELIETSRQQIVALRKETEEDINQQVQQARQALAHEVGTVAQTMMENVLHRRLSS